MSMEVKGGRGGRTQGAGRTLLREPIPARDLQIGLSQERGFVDPIIVLSTSFANSNSLTPNLLRHND
jgi:hypothetical protein